MPNLQMGNPIKFEKETIESIVPSNSIGNYALGYLSPTGSFVVLYVGRSDTDLKARILSHFGDEKANDYSYFKFSIASSKKEAFEKECKNFHDFGGTKFLRNTNHPDKPDGMVCSCPYCMDN